MRAMFSWLLGAFWPLSEPLFRMVNPAADTAADFNRSRRCIWADPLVYIVADSEHDDGIGSKSNTVQLEYAGTTSVRAGVAYALVRGASLHVSSSEQRWV